MIISNAIIKEAHEFLDNHRKRAYRNIILISNNSFDKNPFLRNSSIVNALLLKEFKIFKIFLRCFLFPIYFLKNFIIFFNVLFVYIITKIFYRAQYYKQKKNFDLIIDTFSTNYEDPLDDKYFKPLYDQLDKRKIDYSIVLKESYKKNPFKFFISIVNVINAKNSVIIELLELKISDFIRIFISIFLLPFYSLIYSLSNLRINKRDTYFSIHLLSSLSNTDFLPYSRYLFSKRYFNSKPKKIIMVCEFQDKDLFFIRGIRHNKINHVIHATQFFFKPKNILQFYLTESDKLLNLSPDFVHVICNQYCKAKNYISGPAFRYQYLFKKIQNKIIMDILIVLPYFIDDAIYVLKFLEKCNFLHNKKIPIKLHPDTLFLSKKYNNIFSKFNLIKELKTDNFFKIIISTGTGLMVEKMILGSRVLLIERKKGITTNPIPPGISNKFWESVITVKALETRINRILKNKKISFSVPNNNIIKNVKDDDFLSYFNIN